ncbi:hypothetical protein FOVG_18098 [Fusarium oxysporum f. sp. pisi HDV247]|nr:hypothetical protein FOVG_18098 [Fusarium oxysporum f. sp. pisi HDV247]
MTFETTDSTAMTSYKKAAADWEITNSKPIALRRLQKTSLSQYFRQCTNIFLESYEEHAVVKQLLRRNSSSVCATTLHMLGMLGLLMRGWHEGCNSAPEVLSNQMDSILEHEIAAMERNLLSMVQDSWNSKKDPTTISLVILAVLLLIERDLWRLMHWALYDSSRVDWKHPTPAPDLMRASLQLAQVMLGRFHHVGPWPLDIVETNATLGRLQEVGLKPLGQVYIPSFERPIRYHAGDPTSLDGSLLRRAFMLKQNPETANEVVESLTFDNFIRSHRPEEEQILGLIDINLEWPADMDAHSDFHFISSEDFSDGTSERSSAPRDNQPGSEHGSLSS